MSSSPTTTDNNKSPHKVLTRTVFISRIIMYYQERAALPLLALVTSSWDDCIYEDVGIKNYFPEGSLVRLKLGSSRQERNRLLPTLRCCADFKNSVGREEGGDFDQETDDSNRKDQENSNDDESVSKSKKKRRNKAMALMTKNESSDAMMSSLTASSSSPTSFTTYSQFIEDFSSESENARRYTLTRRVRTFLAPAFDVMFPADELWTAETERISFPSTFSCTDNKYYCFACRTSLRVFEKVRAANIQDDRQRARESVQVLPHAVVRSFDWLEFDNETKLLLYPQPQIHRQNQQMFSSSCSYQQRLRHSTSLFACASVVSQDWNGITVCDTGIEGEYTEQLFHVENDLNFSCGGPELPRADLRGIVQQQHDDDNDDYDAVGVSGYDGNNNIFGESSASNSLASLFRSICWSNDGNYLLAPGGKNILIYDFGLEYKRRGGASSDKKDDERPINTFLLDVSAAHPQGQTNFVKSTASAFASSSSSSSSSSKKEEDCCIAVVSGNSAEDPNQVLSFWDISTLHADYQRVFEKKIEEEKKVHECDDEREAEDNSSSKPVQQIMPLSNDIRLSDLKPEGTAYHLHFQDGLFCPSPISVTKKMTIDVVYMKRKFVETANDCRIFIALLSRPNVIRGYTLDAHEVWESQAIVEKDQTYDGAEKDAKGDLIFSNNNEKFIKLAVTTDESPAVIGDKDNANDYDDDDSNATTHQSDKNANSNFILCVAGDKGTIMILRRDFKCTGKKGFVPFYADHDTALMRSRFRDSNGAWASETAISHSSSHQHLIPPFYQNQPIVDLQFVPKRPENFHHHQKFGSLLLTVSKACRNICHLWRLKPRVKMNGKLRTSEPNFEFLSAINIDYYRPGGLSGGPSSVRQNQTIVSIGCIPKMRVWKDDGAGANNRKPVTSSASFDWNEKPMKNDNDEDENDQKDGPLPFTSMSETSLCLSVKSPSACKRYTYTISEVVAPPSPSNNNNNDDQTQIVLCEKTCKESTWKSDQEEFGEKSPIIRVSIVRAEDEENSIEEKKDYVELEDLYGNIKRCVV